MWKRRLITVGIIAGFVGVAVIINRMEPSRVSQSRVEESEEVAEQIEKTEEIETVQIAAAEEEETVDSFLVEFECSNGRFVIECHPDWAPIGVTQFKSAIEAGVYDEARFFRVIPGFVVQFGIPGNPELAKEWMQRTIEDEPVKQSNVKGTVTFAKSGLPNSRTTQVFINLVNNVPRLQGQGFSAFGKVVQGMEVVEAINSEYGGQPDQRMLQSQGNAYLKENFPNLDYIKKVTILTSEGDEEG